MSRKQGKKKKQNKVLQFVKYILTIVIILMIIVFGIGGTLFVVKYGPMLSKYDEEAKRIIAESNASDFMLNEVSRVYDADGNKIADLYKDAALKYVKYNDLPKNVQNAFIAVEDRTFWNNKGFDMKGIFRVVVNYAKTKGAEKHGASTITQQLARGKYLSNEVSMSRKITELYLAYYLTQRYSKEQIMEFYVNNCCFANGIYGIESASQKYFNKSVSELSLSETAYLCAIPNRPEYYNPLGNDENAIKRRDKILDDMCECGFITKSERDSAKREEISLNVSAKSFNNYETTYAVDCAVRYLMKYDGFVFQSKFENMDEYNEYKEYYNAMYKKYKDILYTKGYTIRTSLNTYQCEQLQLILDEQLAFEEQIDENTGEYMLQGAVTCIDNETGKVVALCGGRSSANTGIYSLNRAYQAYRQPGSSIKPLIVYTPQIERGYTPDTNVQDIDVSVAKKQGVNVQSLVGTDMSLRSAVENSKNGVAWKLFDQLGPRTGMSYLESMQYSAICPSDYYDSSALGGLTYGVTTVEQAGGYCALVNHGKWVEPTCITSIKDANGNELYQEEEQKTIYRAEAADIMVDILKGVPIRGTAAKLKWSASSNTEVMCKTGTTNNSKDGWLCGASPYYTVTVWVGFDKPQALSNLYGATYPGQIWKESMLMLLDGCEREVFRPQSQYGYDEQCDMGYYDTYEENEQNMVADDSVYIAATEAVINQMLVLDKNDPDWANTLNLLYNQACVSANNVVDTNARIILNNNIITAYNTVIERE